MGLKIYKQALSRTFSNPFYCGIIVNKMLNGKLVESVHEKVISKELFLKVNNVRQSANKYGVAHQKELETVPLKVFMVCQKCNAGYTGCIIKKKNLWYYKCRTFGCWASKNAAKVNKQFLDHLSNYEIKPALLEDVMEEIAASFDSLNQASKEQEKRSWRQLKRYKKRATQ